MPDAQVIHGTWLDVRTGLRHEAVGYRATCGLRTNEIPVEGTADVITCIRCIGRQVQGFDYTQDVRQILIDNSVKDIQEQEDAKYLDAVDAAVTVLTSEPGPR